MPSAVDPEVGACSFAEPGTLHPKPANPDAVWEIAVITPTTTARWVEGTATVTVTDGRLTLRSGAGASHNNICFVEITPP
jgi:hypothetical protein